jgi:predicted phosphoribosyltransferase
MLTKFRDRTDAGQCLARLLGGYADRDDVLVLGLPRGGIPVAYEVAKALRARLEVFVVRKIGVPGRRELAMGAIATGGVLFRNEEVLRELHIRQAVFEEVVAEESAELHRREQAYRGHDAAPDLRGKIVILVDDGIATGSTMLAAVEAVNHQGPARLIIAAPAAAEQTCARLRPRVDEVVVTICDPDFQAVGQWYVDFYQTTDEEVAELLEQAKKFAPGPSGSQAAP